MPGFFVFFDESALPFRRCKSTGLNRLIVAPVFLPNIKSSFYKRVFIKSLSQSRIWCRGGPVCPPYLYVHPPSFYNINMCCCKCNTALRADTRRWFGYRYWADTRVRPYCVETPKYYVKKRLVHFAEMYKKNKRHCYTNKHPSPGDYRGRNVRSFRMCETASFFDTSPFCYKSI